MKIIFLILWFIYLFYRTKKSLHMLQQNLYDTDARYIKWVKKNFSKVMLNFEMAQIFLIFFILFVKDGIIIPIISILVYLLLSIRSFGLSYKEVIKKPLVITARIKRLLITICVIYILFIYFGLQVMNFYILFTLLAYLQYFIVLIAQKIELLKNLRI